MPFNAQGVNEHLKKSECEKRKQIRKKKTNLRKKQNNAMKSLEATNSKGHKSCVA